MGKSELTKKNIMEKTVALIKESNGNVEEITIRKIAESANVGVGLVNHYFQSKEKLIEICVQSMISEVILSFQPEKCECRNPVEITKCVAKQVMDFLMANKQVSRISILGDMNSPKQDDNTMRTIIGFANCMQEKITGMGKQEAFWLTVVLQSAFLRKDLLKSTMGIDFYQKAERDAFIDRVVERIGGASV